MSATFAAVFAALYAAHSVGDHWVQTHHQACGKGAPGWAGRAACARHVLTLTVTKAAFLAVMQVVTGLQLSLVAVYVGLAVDAASHYWADRAAWHADQDTDRPATLARLSRVVRKGGFFALGDRATAPTGTGAYALDQSWHHLWLFIAALVITTA